MSAVPIVLKTHQVERSIYKRYREDTPWYCVLESPEVLLGAIEGTPLPRPQRKADALCLTGRANVRVQPQCQFALAPGAVLLGAAPEQA